MSKNIAVSVCVITLFAASCIGMALHNDSSQNTQLSQNKALPTPASAPVIVATTGQDLILPATSEVKIAKVPALSESATAPPPSTDTMAAPSLQAQTIVADPPQLIPVEPARRQVTVKIQATPAQPVVPPPTTPTHRDQIQQPSRQTTLLASAAPLPGPPQVSTTATIAPNQPQSVEAVVVTAQRPQQMARTNIDSSGRGNSLTIELPTRRK